MHLTFLLGPGFAAADTDWKKERIRARCSIVSVSSALIVSDVWGERLSFLEEGWVMTPHCSRSWCAPIAGSSNWTLKSLRNNGNTDPAPLRSLLSRRDGNSPNLLFVLRWRSSEVCGIGRLRRQSSWCGTGMNFVMTLASRKKGWCCCRFITGFDERTTIRVMPLKIYRWGETTNSLLLGSLEEMRFCAERKILSENISPKQSRGGTIRNV